MNQNTELQNTRKKCVNIVSVENGENWTWLIKRPYQDENGRFYFLGADHFPLSVSEAAHVVRRSRTHLSGGCVNLW